MRAGWDHPQSQYLLHQALQKHSFLPQRVMGEAITEGDNSMGEVVLRQPGYHTMLLHVRPASYIHNQVA